MGKRWLLLVFFIILPVSVFALGLSPAQQHLAFEPGLEKNLSILVINGGDREANVTIGFGGELAQYISFEKKHVVLSEGGTHRFSFFLQLPQTILKPGKHLIEIHGIQTPLGGAEGIVALTNVAAQLLITVPYTGKYAELQVSVQDVNEGEPLAFLTHIENLAKEDILSAFTTLALYDELGQLITTLQTNPVFVEALSSEDVTFMHPTTDLKPGPYEVEAFLTYDNILTNEQELSFRIGTLLVEITNYTASFTAGEVNQFDMKVANQWNSPVEQLYGEIQIFKDDVPVSNLLKTPSVSLAPWEVKTLSAFWDAKDLAAGSYTADITLYYYDQTTTKTVDIELVKPFQLNMTLILAIVVVLILLSDFIIWIYHKRKKDEE